MSRITKSLIAAAAAASVAGVPTIAVAEAPAATVAPAAIEEGMFVDINGTPQWITVRGADRQNPVLLWLHGGPGIAMSNQAPLFFAWEKYFTIVQWDQPGGGATYARNGPEGVGDLTVERYAADAVSVAEWSCRHLGCSKLVVIGTSWGTVLGLIVSSRRPDLVAAYVGAGQFVSGPRGAKAGYDAALAAARARGDQVAVAELEAAGPPPYLRFEDFLVRQKYVNPPYQKPSAVDAQAMEEVGRLLAPEPAADASYVARGLPAFDPVEGFLNTQRAMFRPTGEFDAETLGMTFEVPMFFFQGADDLNTPTSLVRDYFARITAPAKELEVVPDVGHFVVAHHDRLLAFLNERVRPRVSETAAGGKIHP